MQFDTLKRFIRETMRDSRSAGNRFYACCSQRVEDPVGAIESMPPLLIRPDDCLFSASEGIATQRD